MHQAGELRRELTPAERKLWSHLRTNQLGVDFRRQHAIGSYITDFCSIKKKLIIELDGGQHLEQEPTTMSARHFLCQKAIGFCAFGTTKC